MYYITNTNLAKGCNHNKYASPLFRWKYSGRIAVRLFGKEDPYTLAAQGTRYTDSVGRFALYMVDNPLFTLLVSAALGFLAGIGVGGGSLLMLWLTLVLKMDHTVARSINLIFFIPSAVISSFFRLKEGKIAIRQILPAVIPGCIGAFIFALLSQKMDTRLIQKAFGYLLLATGVRELLYKPKSANQRERKAK